MPKVFDRAVALQRQQTPRVNRPRTFVPEGPSALESFAQGAQATNDIALGLRVYGHYTQDSGEWDETFRPDQELTKPEYQDLLEIAQADDDLRDTLARANNAEHFAQIAKSHREYSAMYADALENPGAGVGGMLAGALLSPTNLIPGFVAAKALPKIARTYKHAKAAIAARTAALEGGFNVGLMAIEDVADPSVGASEYLLAAGLGVGIGGALGAVIPPHAYLRDPTAAEAATAAAERFSRVAARPAATEGTAGAAAVRDLGDAPTRFTPHAPDPTQSTTIFQRIPFTDRINPVFSNAFDGLRSMKQRVQGINLQYGEDAGVRRVIDFLSGLWDWDQATIREDLFDAPRLRTAESFKKDHELNIGRAQGMLDQATAKIRERFQDRIGRMTRRPSLIPRQQGQWNNMTYGRLSAAEVDYMITHAMLRAESGIEAQEALKQTVRHVMKDLLKDEAEASEVARELIKPFEAYQNFFKTLGGEVKKAGLDPDELINLEKVYFPHRYLQDAMLNDEAAAIDFIEYNLMGDPTAESMDALRVHLEPIVGPDDELLPALQPGVRFADLDPEVQEEVREILNTLRFQQYEEALLAQEVKLTEKLKAEKGAAQEVAMAALVRKKAALEKRQARVLQEITKARKNNARRGPKRPPVKPIKPLQKRLKGIEEEIEKVDREVAGIKAIWRRKDGYQKALDEAKFRGTARERKAAKLAKKKVAKAESRLAKLVAKLDPEARGKLEAAVNPRAIATRIVRNIAQSHSVEELGGFNLNVGQIQHVGEADRMKVRNIDLSRSAAEMDPRLDQFMNLNGVGAMRAYLDQVGGRLALQQSPLIGTAEAGKKLEELLKDVPAAVRADLAKIGEASLDRFLVRHHVKGMGNNRTLRWTVDNMKRWNIMAMLGSSAIQLPGDVGLLHLARESRGFRNQATQIASLFRVRTLKGWESRLNELDQNTLKAIVIGVNNQIEQSSRMSRVLDLNTNDVPQAIGRPGSRMREFTAGLDRFAKAGSEFMMRVNLMNYWNLRMDNALRLGVVSDLMHRLRTDKIEGGYRLALRRAGLSDADLGRLRKAFDKTIDVDGLELPDFENWSLTDQRLLHRAVDGFSAHGIIAPGLGDTPTYANNPLGALVFQFQGFAYAAQQKLVRKIQQKGIGDPLVLEAILAMTMFSVLSDGARQSIRGKGDEWAEDWSNGAGVTQRLYEIFTRSPFPVGASMLMFDLFAASASKPLNTFLEEQAGLSGIFPEASRRRQDNVFQVLGGPAASTVVDVFANIPSAADKAAAGEWAGAGESLWKIAPFRSHFAVRLLEAAFTDD